VSRPAHCCSWARGPEHDDLSSSGFWTYQILAGCNSGFINYYDKQGVFHKNVFFLPEEPMDFSDSPISLVYLEIDQITC